jgi:hypothetical protein
MNTEKYEFRGKVSVVLESTIEFRGMPLAAIVVNKDWIPAGVYPYQRHALQHVKTGTGMTVPMSVCQKF